MTAQFLNVSQSAGVQMTRRRSAGNALKFKGNKFSVEHWRNGLLIANYEALNDIVNVAKNRLLDVFFRAGSPSSTFYLGIINNSPSPTLAASDTISSHAGWVEFVAYSQSTRVAWGNDAASAQSMTNSSPAQFDCTGSATVYGLFVVDQSTKGGTTGNLWATAAFNSGTVPVVNGDSLRVTYAMNL